jgi:hypothetical protein
MSPPFGLSLSKAICNWLILRTILSERFDRLNANGLIQCFPKF